MDTSTASEDVRDRLNDADLYYFIPEDVEEHFFIDQATILQGAQILLGAFLAGVAAGVSKEAKGFGEDLVNWVTDRLQGLFRRESSPDESGASPRAELAKNAQTASDALSTVDASAAETIIDESRTNLVLTLTISGLPEARAGEIAQAVTEVGMQLLRRS